nr:reverse transcriptase domain-containing protein [Tanacetum cinerariifolium]
MLFPFSLEGATQISLEKEPPRLIFTWDDLVSKFINQFFHPFKTTNLRNEITNFQQRFDEYFSEACDTFKDLLRACPHHGFLELYQLDTFYNALNSKDQDSLNSAAGSNFLNKIPRECLAIIESKSKVHYSRNKPVVAKVMMNTSTSGISPDVAKLKDMVKFVNSNNASTSSSSTPPSNTIANSRSNLKAITTRSVVSYDGPQIPPPPSFLPKVVENEPDVTKDTVHPTNNESTEYVQPLVVQSESLILTSKPVNSPIIEHINSPVSAPRPNQKPLIPYPSRLQDQKLRDKANDQREKFFQIFKDLNFNISFSNALILMPNGSPKEVARKTGRPGKFLITCDFPEKAECLALADLDASINLMPLFVWNFDADPRVPLILGRSFLKTERALIDLFKEYSQKVLGFSYVIASGNPTPYYDLIVSTTPMTLTPFENSDFLLEEVDALLALEDDPTLPKVDQSYLDTEGDILLLEAFLNDDPSLPPPNQGNYLPKVRKELKTCEAKYEKSSIDEPQRRKPHSPAHTERLLTTACLLGNVMHRAHFRVKMRKRCEDTNLCLNWEKSHFMVKEGIVFGHKISKEGIKVDKAKVDVITKLPHPTTVKGIRSFLGHASFYRRFIKDFSKIARSMTRLLEKDTPFIYSKESVEAFQTIKRKITEAPILIALDWDMPFELMSDASNFAIGAVLGQRQDKHVRPIHYASKTMTEAESNYTTTKKEMLAVVYAFEKFRSYLIMNKSIVYTDHPALKYLFAKKDSKARLLRWVLLLQDLIFKVIDTKGAENLAADHLSRLENPYQNVLDPKEINESFSLETLNLVSTRGNSSTSWFADFTNYHAGNFVVKGMLSQQKSKFFKDEAIDILMACQYGPTGGYHGPNYTATKSDKLDDAHWAFRTAYKTPTECTPYKLVYGKACHLPIELEHKAYWPLKHANFDLQTAGDHKKVQLNELNEFHDQAYENSIIYKEKTKRLHDSKIKDCVFNISDRVLLFNSRLKIFSGKLKSHWSGPFTISHVYPYDTVELAQSDEPNFKVNGHRIKHYF